MLSALGTGQCASMKKKYTIEEMTPPSKGPMIGIHQNDSYSVNGSDPSIKDRNILGPRSRAGLIAPLQYTILEPLPR